MAILLLLMACVCLTTMFARPSASELHSPPAFERLGPGIVCTLVYLLVVWVCLRASAVAAGIALLGVPAATAAHMLVRHGMGFVERRRRDRRRLVEESERQAMQAAAEMEPEAIARRRAPDMEDPVRRAMASIRTYAIASADSLDTEAVDAHVLIRSIPETMRLALDAGAGQDEARIDGLARAALERVVALGDRLGTGRLRLRTPALDAFETRLRRIDHALDDRLSPVEDRNSSDRPLIAGRAGDTMPAMTRTLPGEI